MSRVSRDAAFKRLATSENGGSEQVLVIARARVGDLVRSMPPLPARTAEKARSNARKHGVPFMEAATVFGDPLAILTPDPDHSGAEARYLLLGTSDRGRLLVIAFAERPPRTRLISARQATPRERTNYEEG